jgi:two-component system, NarL family, sensor kinase
MRIFFLLLSIYWASPLIAQVSERDSLLRLIQIRPEDTNKIDLYYKYGILVENFDLDSAVFYYNKAKALAEKHGHLKGQFRYASNYSAVLNLKGKLEESFAVNKWSLDFARKHNMPEEIAKGSFNVGNVFNFMGRYDSAIVYYLKAAEYFEKLGFRQYLNIIYQSLGSTFDELEQYDNAHIYHDKSIAISMETGDSLTLSSVYMNKAVSLSSQKKYPEALEFFKKSTVISKAWGITNNEQIAYVNMGNLYFKQKQYRQALQVFEEALAICRKMGYTSVATVLNGLAMVHHKLGNYKVADTYIQEALKLSERSQAFSELNQNYQMAAMVKAGLGDYKSAYSYLEKYVVLRDSLAGETVGRNAAELEKKYETAKKDKALLDQQLLLANNKAALKEKQTWLVVSVSSLAVLLLVSALVYRNYRHRQKLQQQKIIGLEKEAEVIRLKAKLDGQQEERQRIAKEIHDEIGSGLTTIVFLSNAAEGNEKMGKIAATARVLVNQMNEIVWSMSTEQDKLEELVAYIRHNVSELLNNVGIDYRFDIPDNIPDWHVSGVQRRNIYLAVKEAVHNSIKHANATLVTIQMDFADGINIRVRDNGQGLQQASLRKFGNGMKNMKHRMERTGGSFAILQENPVQVEMKVPADKIV